MSFAAAGLWFQAVIESPDPGSGTGVTDCVDSGKPKGFVGDVAHELSRELLARTSDSETDCCAVSAWV